MVTFTLSNFGVASHFHEVRSALNLETRQAQVLDHRIQMVRATGRQLQMAIGDAGSDQIGPCFNTVGYHA